MFIEESTRPNIHISDECPHYQATESRFLSFCPDPYLIS